MRMNDMKTGAVSTEAAPAGGYYSRPQFGADEEKYRQGVTKNAEMATRLTAQLQTLEKDISGMGNALQYLQHRWQLATAAGDTAQMEGIKQRYDELYGKYRIARLDYAKNYGDYERFSKAYDHAKTEYETYVGSQIEAQNQWRSTIRDSATVGAELQQVQEQIRKLTQQDNTGHILTGLGNWAQNVMASSSNPGMAGQTYTPQNAKQIAELQAREKLLQEEYEWAMYLPYADLMQNEDFAEKSQYNPQERKPQQWNDMLMDNYSEEASGWDDPLYEAVNGNTEAIGWLRSAGSNYYGPNNAIGAYFGGATEGKTEIQQMTADEISIFNYLHATKGSGAALAYFSYLQDDLNYRERKAEEEYWKSEATRSPVGTSLFSAAMAPTKGLAYLGQVMDYMGDGKIDQNAAYNKFSYIPSAIRQQVAQDIENSIDSEFWGKAGSFGYQTAMSMADFLVTTLASGGNSTLATIVMGSGAAADTVLEGKDRGLSDGQAFALGTIAGVAEALTEKVSLDTLLDKTSLGKNAWGYVLKNMAAESSEEVASSLINTMADVLISQDKSRWQMAIDAYMAQGKTEGQAFGRALADQALALGLDALGGAISGGVMAGGGVAINKGTSGIGNRLNQRPQAAPATFQEENQRQMIEHMTAANPALEGPSALTEAQVEPAMWQQGQRLAQITGRNIKFYEGKPSENGFFDPKTGEIWVNTKGGDPLAQVFSHELTHSVEKAGAYEKLSRLVLNRMQDTGMDLDTAREAKRQQYARQNKSLPTQAAVDQELVAEYVSKHLLTDEAAIHSLVQQDRSLGQKIHDFFDRVLAKLGNKNAQERAFLSRAKNIYAKALRQTQATDMGVAGTVQAEAVQPAGEMDAGVTGSVFLDYLDAQLAAGEISEEDYDEIREEYERWQEEQYSTGERKYSVSGESAQQRGYIPGIVEQSEIESNIRTIADMESVVSIQGDEFKMGDGHLLTDVTNFFESIGGSVHNGRLGDVQLRKRGVKNDLGHGMSDEKAASFAAIPAVLEKGKVAGFVVNKGGKGFDSATIVAPISIGNEPYMMGVIVHRSNGENRFYVHDVVAIKEEAAPLITGTRETGESGGTTSTISIIRRILNVKKNLGRKYSLSEKAKSDMGYLDAVNRGDMDAAQKMVDEAAKAAGYTIKAYHGTSSEFTTFQRGNKRTRGSLNFGSGFYFSPSRSFAENYTTTGRVIGGYLKLEKPYEVFGTRFDQSDLERIAKESGQEVTIENVTQILQQLGYDGIVAKDYNGTTNPVNQYVIFDANQVKSAEVVTHDEGNVIPLSERFDSGGNDIRYSLAEEATEDAGEEKVSMRDTMPRKAAEMLKRTERELLWAIADRLSVPKLAGREYLQPIIQEMADEYLEKGRISPETRQLLFEKAYAKAVIVDAEFYEQYKHIKDHLRTTPVTISDRDRLDIADFNDFRKRAFNTLRIVNEGGLPVDTAYQELQSMAPELFPESITHPADQLVRMFDASRSIQVTEKSVRDYFGKYEPEYRKGAQSSFDEAIAEATGKLWEVKRFAEEQAAKQKESAPATEQEAMEAYQKLKKARRELDKVNAKNLLTESDQMQVGRLLKHEILPEHLKEGQDNVKGILAVFEAKQEYEHLCKLLSEYKHHLRGKARAEADELLKTANSWKDKKVGIAYSRETMERNVMDIIEDEALAQQVIEKYFTPVHTAEAASTRFKKDYRDRVRKLNISRKVQKGNLVSEAYAVQLLGEAQDNIRMLENARGRIKQRDGKNRSEWEAVIGRLWAENPLLDRGRIENAVKEFRKIYDELFQQMNRVRVANGYEPVNYRQGYFPHFQAGDSDSILAQFGRALGIDTRIDALPTTINGMTHAFKPGIQWFGNAQERLGFETAYDAVEGFDKYIEGVANVIHHTGNIQNLRAFASQIRYRTSDEGIRKQVDDIYQRQGLTDEEKQQLITEIYAHGKFTLSGFVAELDEYTNLLAGKKSRYDRAIEAAMGRKAYSVLKAWESRVAANMIAGNLTSALTNFIPWTQAGAQVGYIRLLRGVANTLQSTRSDDGFAGASTFLTNRRGVDTLVQTWVQKASGIASKPMELIDSLVSESIVRAAYEQNRQQGLSEAEAMAQADAFAASVMADRSKGSTPTLFHSTNPLMKAFTQFQLEVNNQFSEVFKDLPRRYRKKKLSALLWVLLKYFLGAWLYNELYEKLIGRRPALDPIGMLCQFGEDWKEDGLGTAGANLASDALGQLPFSSGLTLIGVETDGGRLPASSAVMDLTAIWKAATTEGWSAERRWKEVQDELNKLAYVVPPFGGNQVSKIWKGVKAYIQGGSYSVDAAGNEILQYPVYKDNPGDAFASFVKATILGKSSLGTAQEWVDKGFNSLGAKQTAAYQDMIAAGVKDRDAYALIRQISDAKETDTAKKAAVQRDVLRKSQVSGDGKAIVYYGLMASEKEQTVMDRLADMGADAGAVTEALMDMADVRAKDGSKQADVLAAISRAVLTDEEKAVLVGSVIGTEMLTEEGNLTQYAKFDYAVQNGMGVDQYIQYRASGANIDDYLELRDAGATVEDAMEAAMALQELKDSVEDPSTVQKWKAVIAGVDDPEKQMISLSVVMSDSQYAKLTTARGFGVSPADFVSVNEKIAMYDRDGNGRLTQAEVTQGISNLRLTLQQKAVLWQLITGSSSARNNPYSQVIGERVIAALEKAKAEGQKPGHSFQDEIMRQILANTGK